jgi:hypothetical protein
VIIFDAIRWPSHLGVFETWNTPNDALLHFLRHTVRDAVRVDEIWAYRRGVEWNVSVAEVWI